MRLPLCGLFFQLFDLLRRQQVILDYEVSFQVLHENECLQDLTAMVLYWLEANLETGFFSIISSNAMQTACPTFSKISIV